MPSLSALHAPSLPHARTTRRSDGDAAPRSLLATLILLAVALVVGLALWDEARESSATLEEFATEQTTLANVAATGIASQLEVARRDALAAAAEVASGRALAPTIADSYLRLRVRSAVEPPLTANDDWQAVALTVPVPDGRWVDLLVPVVHLLSDRAWPSHTDSVALLLAPGERAFRTADGRVVESEHLRRAAAGGETSVRLTREEASQIGLAPRTAMAGLAESSAGSLGRWTVVVAASAAHERDREVRARWRLVLGVLFGGGLVVAFGLVALRMQRKELALQHELTRAELEEQRDAQLAREERAALMVTLAAGVAHEVSTPLSVIVGRAEQLEPRVGGDERGRRAVTVILEQSEHIRQVIRGFLHLARGDAPVLDRVEPEALVRTAAARVEHRFDKAGVSLDIDVPGDLPAIRGDARLLEHALVNLLLNACDACSRGGTVAISARADRTEWDLTVVDDGAGISPDDAARVLEPFFSTKASDQGAGLGLAIANEIVKIHRGALALAPRRPRGTVASVRLPILEDL